MLNYLDNKKGQPPTKIVPSCDTSYAPFGELPLTMHNYVRVWLGFVSQLVFCIFILPFQGTSVNVSSPFPPPSLAQD